MARRSVDAILYRHATGGPLPEAQMHVGLAGQWAHDLDPHTQLIRGLTTNTMSDTYYASKRDLAQGLVELCVRMAKEDPEFLAKAAVWASEEGRALNNTAPNVALACLAAVKQPEALSWYYRAFPRILRTPLHVLEHVELIRKGNLGRKSLGTGMKKRVQDALRQLSGYSVVKYRSRAQLRDLLRLTHPKPLTDAQQGAFRWIIKDLPPEVMIPEIEAYHSLVATKDDEIRVTAIEEGNLAWEAVLPVVSQPSFNVWLALLKQMPYMAMLRHLSAVSRHGSLPDTLVAYLVDRLTDVDAIHRAKVLPFQINAALGIYSQGGTGGRSRAAQDRLFVADPRVIAALERALELSFSNWQLPGTVAVLTDVSGSMQGGYLNEGKINTYLDVAALFTAAAVQATDGQARVVAFHQGAGEVPIEGLSFPQIIQAIHRVAGGGTNMAAGFDYLVQHRIPADVVIGITDNESWAGRLTIDALREYRDEVRPKAIFLLTLAPYADSVSPMGEPGIYQIAGWSPSVGQFIRLVVDGHDQRQTIAALQL